MFSCAIHDTEGVVVLAAHGDAHDEIDAEFVSMVLSNAKTNGIDLLLLDFRGMEHHVSEGGLLNAIGPWIRTWSVFNKIALVYGDEIKTEIIKLTIELSYKSVEARLFPAVQHQRALNWLTGGWMASIRENDLDAAAGLIN